MSERLPAVDFLREQIKTARALSPEQPGVIRLSCFDAEELLNLVDVLADLVGALATTPEQVPWLSEKTAMAFDRAQSLLAEHYEDAVSFSKSQNRDERGEGDAISTAIIFERENWNRLYHEEQAARVAAEERAQSAERERDECALELELSLSRAGLFSDDGVTSTTPMSAERDDGDGWICSRCCTVIPNGVTLPKDGNGCPSCWGGASTPEKKGVGFSDEKVRLGG
jgi:hypothetical protein